MYWFEKDTYVMLHVFPRLEWHCTWTLMVRVVCPCKSQVQRCGLQHLASQHHNPRNQRMHAFCGRLLDPRQRAQPTRLELVSSTC